MRKRAICLFISAGILFAALSGCSAGAAEYQRFSTSFFGTFDTVITIIGYAKDEEVFTRVTAEAKEAFERYHRIYDAYTSYDGVKNLYALNEGAGKAPTEVEPELMDLLLYSKEKQSHTQGTVNIALGTVLVQWHEARDFAEANPGEARLPSAEALRQAAQHIDFNKVEIDEEAGTVFFSDPLLRVDVGSVAKGYATERVAQMMLSSEMPSFIISAGGNVRIGNPPEDGRSLWGVGVQDPDGNASLEASSSDYLETLFASNTSVVTSGDYQRCFFVDGKRYHHIISPDTLMPGDYMRAVTVMCEDSGWADILSTALFLMPYEQGARFVDSLDQVEALWVLNDHTVQMTEGMKQAAKSYGASPR